MKGGALWKVSPPKKEDFSTQYVAQDSKLVQADKTSYIVDKNFLERKKKRKEEQRKL